MTNKYVKRYFCLSNSRVHPTPNNQIGVGLTSLRSGETQKLRSKSIGKLIKTSHLTESLKKESYSELTPNAFE